MADERTVDAKEIARKSNQRLSEQVVRRMISEILTSIVFGVVGYGLTLHGTIHSIPLVFVASFLATLFLLLALDDYGLWREVKSRNWKSVTPKFDERPRSPEASTAPTAGEGPGTLPA